MSADDEVTSTVSFSEEDVHVIGGFLAERWDVEGDVTGDIEQAVAAALSHGAGEVDTVAPSEICPVCEQELPVGSPAIELAP